MYTRYIYVAFVCGAMEILFHLLFSDTILYTQFWLQALLKKLQEGSVGTGNNGVIAGVLATVGELARVVCNHNLYFWQAISACLSHIVYLFPATVNLSKVFEI